MSRLAHRTAVASLLTANGICLAVLAPAAARTQPAGVLLDIVGAVVLCYVGTVALVHTCGLAWHLGRGDACRWRHRMQPTPGPRATNAASAVEQQHTEAMAAVVAEPMQPWTATTEGRHARAAQAAPPARDGMTQPMPVVELAAFDYEPAGGGR